MNPEYRERLLSILAHFDQLATETDAILGDSVDASNIPLAEELRELLADARAEVEAKLDR